MRDLTSCYGCIIGLTCPSIFRAAVNPSVEAAGKPSLVCTPRRMLGYVSPRTILRGDKRTMKIACMERAEGARARTCARFSQNHHVASPREGHAIDLPRNATRSRPRKPWLPVRRMRRARVFHAPSYDQGVRPIHRGRHKRRALPCTPGNVTCYRGSLRDVNVVHERFRGGGRATEHSVAITCARRLGRSRDGPWKTGRFPRRPQGWVHVVPECDLPSRFTKTITDINQYFRGIAREWRMRRDLFCTPRHVNRRSCGLCP